MHACGVWMVHAYCIYVYVCVEAAGECQLSSCITLHFVILRQGLSINSELTDLVRLAGQWALWDLPASTSPGLGVQMCAVCLTFKRGCWRAKLRSSSLCGKCFLEISHLPSPSSFPFWRLKLYSVRIATQDKRLRVARFEDILTGECSLSTSSLVPGLLRWAAYSSSIRAGFGARERINCKVLHGSRGDQMNHLASSQSLPDLVSAPVSSSDRNVGREPSLEVRGERAQALCTLLFYLAWGEHLSVFAIQDSREGGCFGWQLQYPVLPYVSHLENVPREGSLLVPA